MQVEYSGLLGVAKGDEEPGSEMIGLAIAIVVLAIAFGSLVAMSLPIGVALIGLLVGSSSIGILAGYVAVPSITTIVATMLGLGVGIDYALFILARHRQNLAEGMPVPEAVGRANATAGTVGALRRHHRGRRDRQPAGGRHPDAHDDGLGIGADGGGHHGRRGHPAPRAARAGRAQGEQPAGAVRAAEAGQRPRHEVRPLGGAGRRPAGPLRVVALVLLGVLAAPAFALRIGFADDGNARRPARCASPTTCSPTASAPGSTARSRSPSRSTARQDDAAALRDIGAALREDRGVASVSAAGAEPGR